MVPGISGSCKASVDYKDNRSCSQPDDAHEIPALLGRSLFVQVCP